MPTLEWLRSEFAYGYDSGNVLGWLPNRRRQHEERSIGGSYRRFFRKEVAPRLKPDARVLELGPGQGSWTQAILHYVTRGEVHTVDFQDVSPWLCPERYDGRLVCHQVADASFSCVPESHFDLYFSFGVLCHHQEELLRPLMQNALSKMKRGGIAIHQYSDWNKLDRLDWAKWTRVPPEFRKMPDEEIWWPRNTPERMAALCEDTGWTVLCPDVGCFQRDSVILLRRD
ncbi:MAG: class I SAM-dependent methyltransferase [Gemmataceae bacterium]|nr:class I SAM-dependent methyltransferase [Gemmataceae bacterium]